VFNQLTNPESSIRFVPGTRAARAAFSGTLSIAPFASLREILRVATTGHYRNVRFDALPLVATATACSLLATAPTDPAVAALLANRDPQRFDELFAALAPATRALVQFPLGVDLAVLGAAGVVLAILAAWSFEKQP
jgi:hypothetical protein